MRTIRNALVGLVCIGAGLGWAHQYRLSEAFWKDALRWGEMFQALEDRKAWAEAEEGMDPGERARSLSWLRAKREQLMIEYGGLGEQAKHIQINKHFDVPPAMLTCEGPYVPTPRATPLDGEGERIAPLYERV